MNGPGQSAAFVHAFEHMNGPGNVWPQCPPSHSLPFAPFQVGVQHAPSFFVPYVNWLAGTHFVPMLG